MGPMTSTVVTAVQQAHPVLGTHPLDWMSLQWMTPLLLF